MGNNRKLNSTVINKLPKTVLKVSLNAEGIHIQYRVVTILPCFRIPRVYFGIFKVHLGSADL